MKGRLEELDSLRGLAALTVIFSHFFAIFKVESHSNILNRLIDSPLHLFFAGHEAVVLFFILSGFVLALPYYNNKETSYSVFAIKRVIRIYIPYIVSVIVAVILAFIFTKGGINELSDWFNSVWEYPIKWDVVIDHIIFIHSFENSEFNPVYWSLVHELRISLVFPLILLLQNKYSIKTNTIIGVVLFFSGFSLFYLTNIVLQINVDYFSTLQYIPMFMIGAYLALYREKLVNYLKQLNEVAMYCLLFLALLAYTYAHWFFPSIGILHVVNDLIISFGASIFIIFSLTSKKFSAFLKIKLVHFMGKISYSIYLYHSIVLLTMLNIFYNKINIIFIFIMTIILTMVLSALSYYWVELPSIKLIKKIQNKYLLTKEKEELSV